MDIEELLNRDMGSAIEWLIDNADKFELVAKNDLKENKAPKSGPFSAGLVAQLEDVIRLIKSDTLIAGCVCYSDKTNGSTAAHFALDKASKRVRKIIDEISN